MSSDDKDDILKALEKMEQTSHEINTRKEKVQERIKKHVKPKTEVSRDEKVKSRADYESKQELLTGKTIVFKSALFCLVALIAAFIQAEGDRVNFIRNVIVISCLYGIYLMKKSS